MEIRMNIRKHAARLIAVLSLAAAGASWAQMTPLGTWHNIDDKTGEIKSELRVYEVDGGAIHGRVEKLLRKDAKPDSRCMDCEGDRKDKLIIGLEIIRGARKAAGKEVWEGGKILDPENGREYALRMTPIEGGRKLDVRGSIAFIGRTQTWVRVQ
jgi:uncharacterized protein (DUF2147 family)